MKRSHMRREILADGRMRMYCGLVMTRDRYQIHRDEQQDEKVCGRCFDNRTVYDLRMEEEQEKLTKAGFLEEDLGPNRRWNEY